jgi:Fe-S-cluster-containing dehydrogenase component/formate-dependent nitrite reductase membrane component NrfD
VTTYGFVIDQRRCIGCHACTVACKSENQVPVGVFRTWVKYVEKGTYPNTRRHFLVQRCNHCANAPCTTICPTSALYRRKDGIVDFDRDRCIGCKACMQACPYDAIYIDPETNTAAKCHYCAHRVERGLQPACVLVCPTEAIISGDLDDPASRISHLVGRETVAVRRPEQGTQPKLWYIGAETAALTPETFADPQGGMWSQHRDTSHGGGQAIDLVGLLRRNGHGAHEAPAGPGASVAAGFLTEGGQVDYNVAHEQPWGFLVSAYLWTKSIGAGALLLAALAAALRLPDPSGLFSLGAPLLAVVFTAITTGLLVADLKRPERFYFLLTKGNRTSWLVKGGYVLMAYGAVATAVLLGGLLDSPSLATAARWLLAPGAGLAVLAAVYSAFLFGQAEGRDFWQSPLLAPHLLAQAVVAGAAALLVVGLATGAGGSELRFLAWALGLGLAAHAGVAAAELYGPHANTHVKLAAATMRHGRLAGRFTALAMGVGVGLPAALLTLGLTGVVSVGPAGAAAAPLALLGLLVYEDLWVTAGQAVPMS